MRRLSAATSRPVIDLHEVEVAILDAVAGHSARFNGPIPHDELAQASGVAYAEFVRRLNYLREQGLLEVIPQEAALSSRDQRVALTPAGSDAVEAERVHRTTITAPGRRSRLSALAATNIHAGPGKT
jgi:DNA-binding MarR family transcriptional regulator